MTYWDDQDFPGLTQAFDESDNIKVYGHDFEGASEDLGDFDEPCHFTPRFLGDPPTNFCKKMSGADSETLSAAIVLLVQADGTDAAEFPSEVLADAGPPDPAFVQIAVSATYTALGGDTGCATEGLRDLYGVRCIAAESGTLLFDATCASASFESGGTETTGTTPVLQTQAFPFEHWQIASYDYGGLLRRPIDGLSYAGNPDNDASRTLIPWAEFIADPVVKIRAAFESANTASLHGASFGITPWYVVSAPPQPRRVWIIGSV